MLSFIFLVSLVGCFANGSEEIVKSKECLAQIQGGLAPATQKPTIPSHGRGDKYLHEIHS
jgi:hypothetical protein